MCVLVFTCDENEHLDERVKCLKNKPASKYLEAGLNFCDLGEARTLDPLIKSQLLYRLSYQVILPVLQGRQRNEFFFDFEWDFQFRI